MAVNGLPTSLAFRNMSRLITGIKDETLTARLELTTGRKQDLAAALNGNVGLVQTLEKTQSDIADYRTAISLAKTRADGAAVGLDIAVASAGEIPEDILVGVGVGDRERLQNAALAARREIDAVFAGLSTKVSGRYVFSGDAVDTPPLASAETFIAQIEAIAADADLVQSPADFEAALDAYFTRPDPDAAPPVAGGGFFTTIYQGGDGDAPAAEIDAGEVLEFGVRADDQAIVDLVRSLATVAVAEQLRDPARVDAGGVSRAFSSAERNAVLETGANGLAAAEGGIIDLRADLGFRQERIETISVRNVAQETAIAESLNDVVAADPFEAATRLTFLETVLQTAFESTARLANLTLTNFLR